MKRVIRQIIVFCLSLCAAVTAAGGNYLSPTSIRLGLEGKEAYVLLSTAPAVVRVDIASGMIRGTTPLSFTPGDICPGPGFNELYVTDFQAEGRLVVLPAGGGDARRSISVGAYPTAVRVNADGRKAWVANRFSNDLSVVDLRAGREKKRIPLVREPNSLALSPDGRLLAVCNLLPGGTSLDEVVAATLTLVDTEKEAVIRHIQLPNGTQSLAGVCFSPEGDLIFVTHIVSRYQFPTTHLDRGWMNTNAVSVIDTHTGECISTVLLDDMYRGAANPCGIEVSDDGKKLLVAISGTHELIVIDLPGLISKVRSSQSDIPSINDLLFLSSLKQRVPLNGKGPRQVISTGNKAYVTNYFSGALSVVDLNRATEERVITLGNEPAFDQVRQGELNFADASLCFQNWQSCTTCHIDARVDGLNWDLLNDGMGNPKNTKSMLFSHVTPPAMITGIRASAEIAVSAGIHHIQFAERPKEDAEAIDAYLRSLRPLPSPYLKNGKLSKLAEKGKKVYQEAGCAHCHNGNYYTDCEKYDVGTGIGMYEGFAFDTPALNEIWRTAPYLYDGRARTMREVLTIFNEGDRHGNTSSLTDKELDALEQYVLSL